MFASAAHRRRGLLLAATAFVAALAALAGWKPLSVKWQVHVARTALAQARITEALTALTAAEAMAPSHPEVLFLLGRACRRDGQLEQAVAYLQQSAAAGWSPQDLRDERYLLMLQRGQFDLAEPYLNEIFDTRTEDALAYQVYEAMVKGYLATYRLQDAILCLDHFIDWQSDAVEPRLWRADVWTRLYRWERARDEYERILEFAPDCHAAWGRLGECLLQLNRVDEALPAFERALRAEPDAPALLLGRAQCYLKLGETAKAAAELEQLAGRPVRDELRSEIALALAELASARKDYAQALVHLEAARDIDPGSAPIRYALGKALARLHRPDDADREFALAETLRKQTSRFAEITQELMEHPGDPELRWEAGSILMEQGYQDTGAAWLATALAVDPEHWKTHEALAAYYTESNQPELAAYHRSFLERSGRNPSEEFVQVDDE